MNETRMTAGESFTRLRGVVDGLAERLMLKALISYNGTKKAQIGDVYGPRLRWITRLVATPDQQLRLIQRGQAARRKYLADTGSLDLDKLRERARQLLKEFPNLTDEELKVRLRQSIKPAGLSQLNEHSHEIPSRIQIGEIMPSKEKIVLLVGALVIVVLGLFPPWREKADIPYKVHFEKSLGYSFIWSPPNSTLVGARQFSNFSNATTIQVDVSRVVIEWIIVAAVTMVLFLFLRAPIQNKSVQKVS